MEWFICGIFSSKIRIFVSLSVSPPLNRPSYMRFQCHQNNRFGRCVFYTTALFCYNKQWKRFVWCYRQQMCILWNTLHNSVSSRTRFYQENKYYPGWKPDFRDCKSLRFWTCHVLSFFFLSTVSVRGKRAHDPKCQNGPHNFFRLVLPFVITLKLPTPRFYRVRGFWI